MQNDKVPYNVLSDEYHLMYLRKSRADNPDESVEEVLAKHESMLQEMAIRELGHKIPEECIIREVVSGESIEERPGMMDLLSRIENPAVKMVWVVDPARLSRGDLESCGKIVNVFRYSSTNVKTLQMVYDLSNKMHRKFFEQELTRSSDFLEYTKEILYRGRVLAVSQKGAYIGNTPPFGYDKIKIDGVNSLTPNDDADAVRLVFDLYVNHGMTYLKIARHLDSLGIKPTTSKQWEGCSIRSMLKNVHYVGMVKWGTHKTERVYENGEVRKRRGIPVDPEETIIAPGKHQAIVTQELFDAAQERLNNNPRAKWDAPLQNPLAGLIFCKHCGKAMVQHPYKHARTRIECRGRKNGCVTRSTYLDDVVNAVVFALEAEHLPELEAKLQNNDGQSFVIQQKQLQKMRLELEELKQQEGKQYDLLEKGFYTEEKFIERNKALHIEMEALKGRIFEASKTLPKEVDYQKKIITLQKAVAGMRDDNISILAKNKLLKAIVGRVEYETVGWEGKGKMQYKLHVSLLV